MRRKAPQSAANRRTSLGQLAPCAITTLQAMSAPPRYGHFAPWSARPAYTKPPRLARGKVPNGEATQMRLGFGEILIIILSVTALGIGIPIAGARRAKRRIALGGGSAGAVVLSAAYLILVFVFAVRAAIYGTVLGIILAVVAGFCTVT